MADSRRHNRARAGTIRVSYIAAGLGRGGAERQLLYMLRALEGPAVARRLLILNGAQVWEHRAAELGVPARVVGQRASRVARQSAVIAALREEPPDIVQSSHFFVNTYAGLAARAIGAVSIGASRNELRKEVQANGALGWGHLFMPHFILANSETSVGQARDLGRSPDRVLLIENVVDTEVFAPPADRWATAEERRLRVLFAGRLTAQKRADRFVRLVRALADELEGWTIEAVVAGDGPLRAELELQARDLGLDAGSVRFVGQVEDMGALYRWSDLLVLPSDFEGTPNVVLEAMAHEVPVVANAVSDVPKLLASGGGLLVDPADEGALLTAVTQLATDPGRRRRLGAEGRRYVVQTRSVSALGPALERIYRSVVDGRR